ncbi:MAG: carotenoid 1,2-hydratase [Hyphomicrobiaceae bacterium]
MSDDGAHSFVVIAFVGSVFSPYYAFARRNASVEPDNHVAINVALYGRGGNRWCMTERGRSALQRTRTNFVVGPSSLTWDGEGLTIDLCEITVPLPSRVTGRIRLFPETLVREPFALDSNARHHWRPIAPSSRVEVELQSPALRWSGDAYFDHNIGVEPIESAFRRWDWSRAATGSGSSVILYDPTERRDGPGVAPLGLAIDKTGAIERFAPPPVAPLPNTLWRVPRSTACDPGSAPRVRATLEDTPFYNRSLVETTIGGRRLMSFHESLDLDRFRWPVVQAMLPFRMPRRAR